LKFNGLPARSRRRRAPRSCFLEKAGMDAGLFFAVIEDGNYHL
jgi:hypothetical protein